MTLDQWGLNAYIVGSSDDVQTSLDWLEANEQWAAQVIELDNVKGVRRVLLRFDTATDLAAFAATNGQTT